MTAIQLPNGNLLVPVRAEDEDGIIGDGMEEIGPDNPEYKEWLEDIQKREAERDPSRLF